MNIKTVCFGLLFAFYSAFAVAGTGHDHSHSHEAISQEQAQSAAMENLGLLVEMGKIDKSWEAVAPAKIEKKVFNGHPEWVVVFSNEGIADPKKRTLYIFLSLGGEYIAANYTGN